MKLFKREKYCTAYKMGMIFNIQRFSLNDGPGIRTTVFLKGCPLNCAWCHNPESKVIRPQLSFNSKLCLRCGNCFNACPNGVHIFEHNKRVVDWKLCKTCNICASACPSGALEIIGCEKDADEIVEESIKDILFYNISGGESNVIFNWEECLCSSILWMKKFLGQLRKNLISIRIYRSGYGITDSEMQDHIIARTIHGS